MMIMSGCLDWRKWAIWSGAKRPVLLVPMFSTTVPGFLVLDVRGEIHDLWWRLFRSYIIGWQQPGELRQKEPMRPQQRS